MLNIAIDGTASSGKSTLARELAKKLDVYHFNTGSVYRAVACEYLHNVGEEISKERVVAFAKGLKAKVVFENGEQICYMNGNNYAKELRTEKISSFVAKISPFVEIREIVRQIQRDFAKENNCVMEGRDIGRVVLKDAEFKFFITADIEVRARRRYNDVKDEATFEEVLFEMKKRDEEDINREEGALIPAENAIIIDTSDKNIEQTTNICLNYVRKNK